MSKILGKTLAAACALLVAGTVAAQEWPTRPIKLIVPYLPGTSPDTTARIVADAMGSVLKQTIVIENKPGAAGNLGAQAAARATPDGYTWVYAASPMSASMRTYRKPGFDVMKDFTMIGRINVSDLLVIAPVDAGLRNATELVERARRNPGQLNFASGGIGSPAHLGAELMLNVNQAKATHVPYKGASESLNAVIGKQVDFALVVTSVGVPQVRSGKVAALAVTGPQRNPALPQVPTLAELGMPGATLNSFGGLAVPAGTPAPLVQRIAATLREALAKPEVRAQIEQTGSSPAPSTPDEYTAEMRAEIGLTEKMMKAAGLEPQ